MMEMAKERKSNSGLMYFSNLDKKTTEAMDLVSTIAVERPLRSSDEARISANSVNNVLAFVEYGTLNSDSLPGNTESVLAGIQEIITACRLVSLRVEQYIDQLPDEVLS